MLTDRIAEHIPGCNMAFYKWALEEIGGFDPIFRQAGDDVDVCWRLQQRGFQIGFSPAGFVWHYRRSTVSAYLKQQRGYGEAEALLVRRHPEYFNSFGSSIWHGRIYTASKLGIAVGKPIIYHGLFATGFFQTLYQAKPAYALMMATTLEYHVFVNLPLLVLSVPFHRLFPLAVASLVISLGVCVAAAGQAELDRNKRRFWSRPLIALLFFLQPIARGWARYQGRLSLRPTPQAAYDSLTSQALKDRTDPLDLVEYWAEKWVDRLDFVKRILNRLDEQEWQNKIDAGWSEFDVEVFGSRWARLQLTTVGEPYAGGKQLLRCRMRTAWSLPAKLAFYTMIGFEMLVIGFVQERFLWIWLLLLTLPIFIWFMVQEQRDLQRLISVLIDDVAKQCGLLRMNRQKPAEKPAAHQPNPPPPWMGVKEIVLDNSAMKVTQVAIRPSEASDKAGRPALTPELLAASGARYSRNNEGLDAILAKIDPSNLEKSVDSIFRMVDYGHQSIADMVPVAMFIDGVSIWLAYYLWTLCPNRRRPGILHSLYKDGCGRPHCARGIGNSRSGPMRVARFNAPVL